MSNFDHTVSICHADSIALFSFVRRKHVKYKQKIEIRQLMLYMQEV